MNQTLAEIVSSLSGGSKNTSKVRGHRDSDATATDGEPVQNVNNIEHKVSVNDKERCKLYYDKSMTMIAPKATDVPIF